MSAVTRNRVEVMHGVNLDMLGSRDHDIYGDFTLPELEVRIKRFARDLDLEASFFQTNSEGDFVEHLHRLPERADAALINAGAWTHYSWAIRDALDLTGIPSVEVHISDISKREEWRRHSVFDGLELILGQVYGKGPDGYGEALELIAKRLGCEEGERLAQLVGEKELDQLFVSDLVNVRYLTGFTGTNGACLIGSDELVFFTDFRYTERAKTEVSPEWERPEAVRELVPQIVGRMKGRVGFEDAKLSVRQLARLEAAAGEDVELIPAGDLVEQLRAVKEPEELERIAAAAELSDGVYNGRSSAASRAALSATSPARSRLASASSALSPPSRRSSRPRRTGPCRTPSRASVRSAPASWSSSTWAPCWTATLGLHAHLRDGRPGDDA